MRGLRWGLRWGLRGAGDCAVRGGVRQGGAMQGVVQGVMQGRRGWGAAVEAHSEILHLLHSTAVVLEYQWQCINI